MEGLEEKRGKSKSVNKGRPRKNPLSPEEELVRFRAENEYLKKLWALDRGHLSTRNDLQLVIDTLEKAQSVRPRILYTSRHFCKLLKQYKMKSSMSRKGNCLDIACMDSEEALISAIHEYMRFYNYDRFQAKLNKP